MTTAPTDLSRLLAAPPGPTRTILSTPVTDGTLPEVWDSEVSGGQLCADHDRMRFWTGQAGVYVDPAAGVVIETSSPEDRLAFDYLVYATSARAVLTISRRFNLHATLVVSPEGQAIAISGHSGSGKSTTMLELMRRGWTFACDDILEVRIDDGEPVAVPLHRPVHLSDAAVRSIGADPSCGRFLPRRLKRVYSVEADLTPRSLSGIVRLRLGDAAETSCDVVAPLQALPTVLNDSDPYRIGHLPSLRARYMQWAAAVVDAVPVYDVARPARGDSVRRVADVIERLTHDAAQV